MKSFFTDIRAAIVSTLVFAIVCCGIYPVVVWGIAQAAFKEKANGSLIVSSDGTIVGSSLIGQNFTGEKYFHSRPSAAGANGYDAASSGGSNLGPTSQKLHDAIKDRTAIYRVENSLSESDAVPADAVTASGSGLDPHISVKNAEIQAARVAKARNLSPAKVVELVRANTQKPDLGVFGDARVNVLTLNLSLDSLSK
jgi:K+-transporting ATPase ATPase C chain